MVTVGHLFVQCVCGYVYTGDDQALYLRADKTNKRTTTCKLKTTNKKKTESTIQPKLRAERNKNIIDKRSTIRRVYRPHIYTASVTKSDICWCPYLNAVLEQEHTYKEWHEAIRSDSHTIVPEPCILTHRQPSYNIHFVYLYNGKNTSLL